MLEEARRKLALVNEGPVAWVQGRAEALPFRTAAFDCVTLGFALRHVEDLDATLREIGRMLRSGGRFVLVEWTRPRAAIPRWLFLGYMRWVVPSLVRLVSRDRRVGALAAYLPRSIASFMSGEALSRRVDVAGLKVIDTRSYMLGLVFICVGLNTSAGAERWEPKPRNRESESPDPRERMCLSPTGGRKQVARASSGPLTLSSPPASIWCTGRSSPAMATWATAASPFR